MDEIAQMINHMYISEPNFKSPTVRNNFISHIYKHTFTYFVAIERCMVCGPKDPVTNKHPAIWPGEGDSSNF